jgi:type I restriction enzyme S subunit
MADTPLIDIRPDHWAIISDILRRHVPHYEVWAFGSRARWTAKQYSDLDLAIITNKPLPLATSAALSDDFSESDLPWKVDVVDWATTSESFRKIIERDKVVVLKPMLPSDTTNEWPIARIKDIAEKVAMGPFGSNIKVETFVETGIPIISGAHLRGIRVEDSKFNFVTEEHAERMKNSNVFRGDVIFTHAGNIGQVAYIPPNSRYKRYVISQRQFYLRCDLNKADPVFVSYFFHSNEGRHKLLANVSQTGVPSIARPSSYLKTIELPLPPLEEQRAIAHILGALDDKIELSQRTNATLEAMARALFKSWFVDFDGVPPQDMQESELGLIPNGWRVGKLGDVAEHPRRSVQPEKIESTTPYIALEHMPRRCIALTDWGMAVGLESNKYEFKRGEILFGKLRPYFHKVGVAPIDGVCSTDIVVIAPKSPAWFCFVLAHTSSNEFVEYTNAGSTGTKMPRTSWREMSRYAVVLPPESIATAFNHQIQQMAEKIISNIHASRTLAALRDTLLPKLLSGELRVKDAERIAEAMA